MIRLYANLENCCIRPGAAVFLEIYFSTMVRIFPRKRQSVQFPVADKM